jgi:hypothetical protein
MGTGEKRLMVEYVKIGVIANSEKQMCGWMSMA